MKLALAIVVCGLLCWAAAKAGPVTRSDGARPLYLPPTPASAQNPAYSPDGSSLLFTIFHKGYNHGPAGMFFLTPGSSPRVLFDEPGYDAVNLPGTSWHRSGKIVFASDRQDAGEQIWSIAASGGQPTRITQQSGKGNFQEPSFSPNARWIAFESPQGICKIQADGSGFARLTHNQGDTQPNWSPRDNRILFQRKGSGESWHLYTVDAEGKSAHALTSGNTSNTDASWSPDGRYIVFSSNQDGLELPNLFVVNSQGGRPCRLTRSSKHYDGAPTWSPDGRKVAFESREGDDEDDPTGLWVVDIDVSRYPLANVKTRGGLSSRRLKSLPWKAPASFGSRCGTCWKVPHASSCW